MEEIYLLGINHETAPLEIREKFAFHKEEARYLKDLLKQGALEAALLSTCNRTELYLVSDKKEEEAKKLLLQFLEEHKEKVDTTYLYFHQGKSAVEHLFRVAAGLNSLILGETQILGQVKQALQLAQEENTVRQTLTKLFERAIRLGKLVRRETRLSEGALSIPYAAAELAKKIFGNLTSRSALLIGAGETAELAALHLKKQGLLTLYIANRTYSRAEKLARKMKAIPLSLEEIFSHLPTVDIVIGAIHSESFILEEKHSSLFTQSSYLLLDLGVPRNFSPALGEKDHIFLYTVDELEQVVKKNLERRKKEIPKAEEIVRQEVRKYLQWKQSLISKPLIVELQRKYQSAAKEELKRIQHKLPKEHWPLLEELAHRLTAKFLHAPLVQIKKYAQEGNLTKLELTKQLFQINGEKHED